MHDSTQLFETRVLESLSRLETNMTMIVGNGQPGILTKHDGRLHDLEQEMAENRGGYRSNRVWYSSISAIVLSLLGLAVHLFAKK